MWGTARVEIAPAVADGDAIVPSNERLRLMDWLFRSNYASVIWLVIRVWLGYQWLDAGYQKIWGSEKMAFWYGGGAGVYGFASAASRPTAHPWAPSASAGGQGSCTTSSCRTRPGSRR